MVRSAFVFLAWFLFQSAAFPSTIFVPDNYPNIRIAIVVAGHGDKIIVRQGTYVERIDFLGKAVTLESERGAEFTIIDGNQAGSVVTFKSGEGESSVLRGFTITNGLGTFDGEEFRGGGIRCDSGSSPTLTENIISENYAEFGGGGISCNNNSSPVIIDNTILNNEAGLHGGGLYLAINSNARVENNRFEGNRAGFAEVSSSSSHAPSHPLAYSHSQPIESLVYSGGGIYSTEASPKIMNNIIISNEGKGHGGGILCNGLDHFPVLENNTLYQNTAEKGAGIYCCHNWSDLTIRGNIIYENQASHYGGGICCRDQSTIIERNRIYDNTAELGGGIFFEHTEAQCLNNCLYGNTAQGGGGIYAQNTVSTLSNNSLFRNSADYGGGVVNTQNSEMLIVNTLLSDNIAVTGPEVWIGNETNTSSVKFRYSLVKEGTRQVHTESGCTLDWGTRMIESDPKMIQPAQGNFHLSWLSPCVNRGTFDHAPGTDFDGDLRPSRGSVDIGADEYVNVLPLDADTFQLNENGGAIHFALFGDVANANRNYLLLATTSGNAPGVPLPGNLVRLPLNWDPMTDLVLLLINAPVFSGFLGQLDQAGNSQATLNAPALPPGFTGMKLHFAFCLNNPFNFVSNPIPAEIVR
ncbi:MAG: right-handed parallel beta-helix repeat-containing protein [Planctomycetota bacterium]